MKKTILVISFMLLRFAGWACPVCDRQQTGPLKGYTHGGGAQNDWDYLIIAVMMVIVLATLFFSVKWLLRPGEKGDEHIKRLVLNYE